jgi:hypothetical protein
MCKNFFRKLLSSSKRIIQIFKKNVQYYFNFKMMKKDRSIKQRKINIEDLCELTNLLNGNKSTNNVFFSNLKQNFKLYH